MVSSVDEVASYRDGDVVGEGPDAFFDNSGDNTMIMKNDAAVSHVSRRNRCCGGRHRTRMIVTVGLLLFVLILVSVYRSKSQTPQEPSMYTASGLLLVPSNQQPGRESAKSWDQLSSEIVGPLVKRSGEGYGHAIALSEWEYGPRLAIGLGGNAQQPGFVQVFHHNKTAGWVLEDTISIPGNVYTQQEGEERQHLAMAGDARRVVFTQGNYAFFYYFKPTFTEFKWKPLNDPILIDSELTANGEADQLLETKLALSNAGNVVAIASETVSRAQLKVYKDDTSWTQNTSPVHKWKVHSTIPIDQLIGDISISGDATRLAIGNVGSTVDDNGDDSGKVQVYGWQGGDWYELGQMLRGNRTSDRFGSSIALNLNGDVLAVASNGSHRVQVYRLVGDDWEQLGSDLYAMSIYEKFGHRIELSRDGYTMASSSPGTPALKSSEHSNDPEYMEYAYGRVYIMQFNLDELQWKSVGFIRSDIQGDSLGSGLALSHDGHHLACGSPTRDVEGHSSIGVASVYRIPSK